MEIEDHGGITNAVHQQKMERLGFNAFKKSIPFKDVLTVFCKHSEDITLETFGPLNSKDAAQKLDDFINDGGLDNLPAIIKPSAQLSINRRKRVAEDDWTFKIRDCFDTFRNIGMGKSDPAYLGREKLEELQTKALSIQTGKFEDLDLPTMTKTENLQFYSGQKVIAITQLRQENPDRKFFHAWDAMGTFKNHALEEFHNIPQTVTFYTYQLILSYLP